MIWLLGAPRVEREGVVQPPPRGNKVWGLLAYLLISPRPVSRAALCSLLFSEAENPLAALRWNLTEIRRLLGDPAAVRGDPVALNADSDVAILLGGTWTLAQDLDGVGADLLESLTFPSCPSFDVWLESERHHLRGASESMLREGALISLTTRQPDRAADLAARLVALNPLDENFQALLVRSLAAAGRGVAAARQAAACRELFRRELGVEPGPALSAAAKTVTATPTRSSPRGPSAVSALIEAGTAATQAGALDAGLDCLRRAVDEARQLADRQLEARALVALGSTLVHASRGRDEEGATALHQALSVAGPEHRDLEAEAARELGYVEFLTARYERVEPWLQRAQIAAGSDRAQQARVLAVRGSALSDLARYDEALVALTAACDLTHDERVGSYSLSMIGRLHLLRGDLERARDALDTALDLTVRHGLTAFKPWPQSLRAEVHLAVGDTAAAAALWDEAFAMSCHLGDPCWEGMSARGLGLLHARAGDLDSAVSTLLDARRRCSRLPDGYRWLDLYILDALCGLAVSSCLQTAETWVGELVAAASHTGTRELLGRGLLHRVRLGHRDVLDTAATVIATVGNPRLDAELAELLITATG